MLATAMNRLPLATKNPSERFPSSGGRGRARTPPGEWDCPEPEDPFRNRHSDGYGAQSSHMRGSRNREGFLLVLDDVMGFYYGRDGAMPEEENCLSAGSVLP
ncbi:unnamed protein product, partial [Nesidiocoris tenuis]